MGYPIGFIDSEGRRFFRCISCSDSDDPNKCHMFYDVRGGIHCYRCGYNGFLPMKIRMELYLNNISIEEVHSKDFILPDYEKKKDGRFSLLDKYESGEDQESDSFAMRNQHNEIIGYHTRYKNKKFKNEGRSGINWSYDTNLISSPSEPLVIVEGPYDVIKPNYVCMFGSLSKSNISKFLKHQYLWLFPDPDIINTIDKRRRFVIMMKELNQISSIILGLIVGNDDPDKATILKYYNLDECLENIK